MRESKRHYKELSRLSTKRGDGERALSPIPPSSSSNQKSAGSPPSPPLEERARGEEVVVSKSARPFLKQTPGNHNRDLRMDRRQAIKWMLTASAALSVLQPGNLRAASANPRAVGYGTDPNLLQTYSSGELWPLTFTPEQRQLAAALCDVILPADDKSPSASSLMVQDFVDEWISAPYAEHQEHKKLILEGLAWMDAEAHTRFKTKFINLSDAQKQGICDDICHPATAKKQFAKPAQFFSGFRNLATSGFYTTPEGMKDLGYVGNVPLQKFDGPPREVLEYLKLDS